MGPPLLLETPSFTACLCADTGRLVGTGCSGPMAARMAILKAVRQLAREAKVYVHIRKSQVINQARLRNLNTHVITRDPQATSLVCAGRRRVHRRQARLRRLRLDALGDVALRSRQLCRCVRACVPKQPPATPGALTALPASPQASLGVLEARASAAVRPQPATHTRTPCGSHRVRVRRNL